MGLFSSHEMAKILKIDLNAFYQKCFREKIKAVKVEKNISFYKIEQFEKHLVKYYPIKMHEVFYIYESKINN